MGAARTTEKEYDNGNHRLFHRFRQRLLRHHQDPQPQRQGNDRPGRAHLRKGPTSASSQAMSSSAQPGRRPRTKAATTSRSSSTIRASRPRSTQRSIEVEGEEGLSAHLVPASAERSGCRLVVGPVFPPREPVLYSSAMVFGATAGPSSWLSGFGLRDTRSATNLHGVLITFTFKAWRRGPCRSHSLSPGLH
jgi:hypothetical protein